MMTSTDLPLAAALLIGISIGMWVGILPGLLSGQSATSIRRDPSSRRIEPRPGPTPPGARRGENPACVLLEHGESLVIDGTSVTIATGVSLRGGPSLVVLGSGPDGETVPAVITPDSAPEFLAALERGVERINVLAATGGREG